MTGPVGLAGAAAAVVVWGAWCLGPPTRVRALGPEPAAPAPAAHGRGLGRLLDRLGLWLLRRLGRSTAGLAPRRAGTAAAAGVWALAVWPPAALPAAVAGWALPGWLRRREQQRRHRDLAADLPDVVDLLVLAVGAGGSVHQALSWVAQRTPGPLGAEMAACLAQTGRGRRLADALEDLPSRAGEQVRPLVAALVATDRYGSPLGPGLERLAREVRADRRRAAEEAARKVPVKLLFPLVCCTLPALGLLTVAPLVISALWSLEI